MDYKLVVLDLDGTLLSEDKGIAPSTLRIVDEAKARGVQFTIATGRMSKGAVRYAQQLGVSLPIITYNGAIVRSLDSSVIYRERRVPVGGAVDAINALGDEAVLRFVFLRGDVYTDVHHDWTDRYAKLLGVEMNYVDDIVNIMVDDPMMLVFMVPDLRAVELTEVLKSALEPQVRVTNSTSWFVDILHPEASKGLALKHLADHVGIQREEIIAIGDNRNDLEMIEYAGLGVAVANASDDLKAVADYVCEEPFNKGVEEVILQHILYDPAYPDLTPG